MTGLVLTDLDDGSKVFCEPCTIAKAKCHPVAKERLGEQATTYGGEIHSDLWGPAPLESLGRRRYYVSYTDNKTCKTTLYLLREKLETFETYKRFEAWVRNHRDAKIKVLRTDRGGEYLSNEFTAHLEAQGTEHILTVHDTPQQNGVAERLNGILAEKVHALLYDSGLPRFLWGEAVNHATWLKNRTSTKALDGKTPFEAVHGEAPNLTGLPVWGARVWVHDADVSKIDSHARLGRWVGYDTQSRGHHVYWPDKRSVGVEQNVRFETGEVDLPPAHTTITFEGEGGVAGNRNAPGTENDSNRLKIGQKSAQNNENSPLGDSGPTGSKSDDPIVKLDALLTSECPHRSRNPS